MTNSSIAYCDTSRSLPIACLASTPRVSSSTANDKVVPFKQQTAHETSSAVAAGAEMAATWGFLRLCDRRCWTLQRRQAPTETSDRWTDQVSRASV
jgi:hypothetical protein